MNLDIQCIFAWPVRPGILAIVGMRHNLPVPLRHQPLKEKVGIASGIVQLAVFTREGRFGPEQTVDRHDRVVFCQRVVQWSNC
jgi:hypothetical protein